MGYTTEQENAVKAPVQNILVTAAAGAGKTHVLTGRILSRIMDEASGTDIDRLLIITFTRAAASEMRERIASAVLKASEDNPENARLKRQYNMVQNASVMTMDSFCVETLRSYFLAADIDPNFTIMDAADEEILKKEVMEECFEEYFVAQNPRFIRFLDAYGGMRGTESAEKIILSLHTFLQTVAFPEAWRKMALEKYEITEFENSFAEKCLVDYVARKLLKAKKELYGVMNLADAADAHNARVAEDILEIEALAKSASLEEYKQRLAGYSMTRMPTVKGTPIPKSMSAARTTVKKMIAELTDMVCIEKDALLDSIVRQYPTIDMIMEIEKRFSALLFEKKKSRNGYSFSDLERITLELLTEETENGYVPSATAKEIREKFDEIYIDEYQDTNSMQEAIFGAISGEWDGEPNTFRVGDLKQSIYRFRHTNPELFAEKKRTYTYDGEKNRKIVMSRNFRSRPEVLSAINDIFVETMTERVGAVDYTDREEWLHAPEELMYHDTAPHHEKAELFIRLTDENEKKTSIQAEAYMVGEKILALMQDPTFFVFDKKTGKNRRPEYRDFAVLTRKKKEIIPEYIAAFEALGIPVLHEAPENFYENYEVAMLLSLLSVIDNPLQDVPLAAVLHSPMFDFSVDLLSDIRYFGGKGEIYTAMQKYVTVLKEKDKSEQEVLWEKKVTDALEKLKRWNEMARILPLVELMELLIRETGWDDYVSAMPGGTMRLHNIKSLCRRAEKYESVSYRGLAYFLQFVDKTKQQEFKEDVSLPMSNEINTPHIMSIHKSKGLEFPVVFVVNADKKFNEMEAQEKLVLLEEKGMAIVEVDEKRRISQETLYHKVFSDEIIADIRSDEIRILYVAMTRAREKLYVSACLPQENYERVREAWTSAGEEDSMFARSYLDWVAPAAMKSTHWTISEVTEKPAAVETEAEISMTELQEETEAVSVNWEDRFSFSYPYEAETTVPGKFSVTELKRMHALEEDTASFVNLAKKPKFAEEMKKGFTNAEKGSIIHTILEHMDFRTATKEKLPEILADMVQKGILSAQETEAIDCSVLEAFLQSHVFRRMQNADVLYRETPFTYLKPIGEIMEGYTGEESTMVQGIIDCWFKEGEDVILVDYKTDRVSSKNELIERYRTQLALYDEAIEHITGEKAAEMIIYSLYLKEAIVLEKG